MFLCLALVACSKKVIAIGKASGDNVPLTALPEFAEYLGALNGAAGFTVADLYTKTLTFSATPNPTALLVATQAGDPAAASNAVPVRMLSYNLGLLDATVFGFVTYTTSPDLAARQAVIFDLILAEGYDVITFQEIWDSRDVDRLRKVAAASGYWVATSTRDGFTDGLAIAVKKTFAPAATQVGSDRYEDAEPVEFFPANGYVRGFLYARMNAPGIGSVVVYSTHMAPFPAFWRSRMANARELGLQLSGHTTDDEIVLVGGDMNASPYYRKNDWQLPNGKSEDVWLSNTISYPVLLHYGGLTDMVVRGRSAADAALDVTLGDLVPNDPGPALKIPFGVDGYCQGTPQTLFTATDCNVLYFEQYAGTEFPARIDHLLTRDPKGRVHVAQTALAFTKDVAYGGKTGPLSDHYAQSVDLLIAP